MKAMSANEEFVMLTRHLQGDSYRELQKDLGISHSTLQRRFPETVEKIKTALIEQPIDQARTTVQSVLVQSLVGQTSSRNSCEAIDLMFGVKLSHDTNLEILKLASTVAKTVNDSLDLKPVKTASFDELFQSSLPILDFVDNKSGVTVLSATTDRSSGTWEHFLRGLQAQGLNPSTSIGDGATGLGKAISIVHSEGVFVLDLFHFMAKLLQAKNKAEGICYALIIAKDGEKAFSTAYYKAGTKMNIAIDLFDQIEPLYNQVKNYAKLAHPGQLHYISSSDLLTVLTQLRDLLTRFCEKIGPHRKIIDARNYIKNNLKELTAYKAAIESEITDRFQGEAKFVLDYILPIIEYWEQYERSYENKKLKTFWAEKIIKTTKSALSVVPQYRFDELLNQTAQITEKYARSNSLVENINNQIRRYMDTYKCIPSWFCDLFSFYWNYRRFKRGKRAGLAPVEILTGKRLEKNWLDILLDNFPYHKLRLAA